MFSVPGWKLSSANVKREEPPGHEATSKSNKRKRSSDTGGAVKRVEAATSFKSGNVSDNQDHTQNRSAANPSKRASELAPVSADDQQSFVTAKKSRQWGSERAMKQMAKKSHQGDSGRAMKQTSDPHNSDRTPHNIPVKDKTSTTQAGLPTEEKGQPTKTSATKLTALQDKMRQKLMGAHFRHLNETLYTTDSTRAKQLFEANPTFFDEYHDGFKKQVESWPENPVESFAQDLLDRAGVTTSRSHKPSRPRPVNQRILPPLPARSRVCKVADMGCGDATLAHLVRSKGTAKTRLEVTSYDLQAANSSVIKADIANLPVASSHYDLCVLCLALMGTNWVDFVEEAWRVLRWSGELWIAEIKSRFRDNGSSKGKGGGDMKVRLQSDADVAHQGLEDRAEAARQTDVERFVTVLRRRGFAPASEDFVDASNKMFVKMRFVKAETPKRGKHMDQGSGLGAVSRRNFQTPRQFTGVGTGKDAEEDEAEALRPCLYKVR